MERPGTPSERCAFLTERLRVGPWHELENVMASTLVDAVVGLLTEATTRALPVDSQGAFSAVRARTWIGLRDTESPTLMVLDRHSSQPLGLVILFEQPLAVGGSDIRIGYLLSETAWGHGIATELVEGIVTWAEHHSSIATLTAGVGADNPASRRVLEKAGFAMIDENGEGEATYRRSVPPPSEWDDDATHWDDEPAVRAYSAAVFASLLPLLEQNDIDVDGASVCDFGCGTGLLTERLVGAGARVTAVDTSSAMLAVLDAKVARNGWGGVETTSFLAVSSAPFDLIVCSSVCSFLDDYPGTVAALAKLLRSGGLFVQWDWERTDDDPESHGLRRSEIRDALAAADLDVLLVETGFELPMDDDTMAPLMGVGRRR